MRIDQEWQAKLKETAAALEQAHADRDSIIVEADHAGVPKQHIADGIGLSVMQVQRIIKANAV